MAETKQIISQDILIHLDSQYASFYNNSNKLSDVEFKTPELSKIFNNSNQPLYKEISVIHATFNNILNAINDSNNTLNYTISGSNFTVILSNGNYTFYDFVTEFKNKFLANGHAFTITQNINTGILSFTYTSNFSFHANSKCLGIIGLKTGKSSISNILLCDYPMNISGSSTLKIQSTNLFTDNIFPNGGVKVLSIIPLDVGTGFNIYYENKSAIKNYLHNDQLDFIDIQIFDDNNQLVDFLGIHWQITLKLSIYRYLNTSEKMDFFKRIQKN